MNKEERNSRGAPPREIETVASDLPRANLGGEQGRPTIDVTHVSSRRHASIARFQLARKHHHRYLVSKTIIVPDDVASLWRQIFFTSLVAKFSNMFFNQRTKSFVSEGLLHNFLPIVYFISIDVWDFKNLSDIEIGYTRKYTIFNKILRILKIYISKSIVCER